MAVIESFGFAERDEAVAGNSPIARALGAAMHLCPSNAGVGRIANSALFEWVAPRRRADEWVDVIGGSVLAPMDDDAGRALYFAGDVDVRTAWIVDRVLNRGDVALDIGASLGAMTMRLSDLVLPEGVVLAFEPNPVARRLLTQSVARSRLRNVRVMDEALGDREDVLTLSVPRGDLGGGSLGRMPAIAGQASHRVHMKRLDAILDVDMPVALMKIDVEGWEASVLRGAEAMLAARSAHVVLFKEFAPSWDAPTPDSFALLQDHGYDLFAVPRCLVRMSLTPIARAQAERMRAHDYVAIARDPATATTRRRLGVN